MAGGHEELRIFFNGLRCDRAVGGGCRDPRPPAHARASAHGMVKTDAAPDLARDYVVQNYLVFAFVVAFTIALAAPYPGQAVLAPEASGLSGGR